MLADCLLYLDFIFIFVLTKEKAMESLGNTLKKTRTSIPLTLRQVEDATGISNAYLSQLENDKIKRPSANILYKLANLYKIDLNILLKAAGIIEGSLATDVLENDNWMNKIAFYSNSLNENDKDEILSYVKFKAKKSNG